MERDIVFLKGFVLGFSVACLVTGAVSSYIQYKGLTYIGKTVALYLSNRSEGGNNKDDIISRMESFFMR